MAQTKTSTSAVVPIAGALYFVPKTSVHMTANNETPNFNYVLYKNLIYPILNVFAYFL